MARGAVSRVEAAGQARPSADLTDCTAHLEVPRNAIASSAIEGPIAASTAGSAVVRPSPLTSQTTHVAPQTSVGQVVVVGRTSTRGSRQRPEGSSLAREAVSSSASVAGEASGVAELTSRTARVVVARIAGTGVGGRVYTSLFG